MNEEPYGGLKGHLPPGMCEKGFREAVDRSGYPLQTVVAGELADREFRIEEEWAWDDPEGDTQRSLDILAEGGNGYWHHSEEGRVQVVHSLLIECKQSRNPYLGFAAVSPPMIERHPHVLGLRPEIHVRPEAVRTAATAFPLLHVLGLRQHPYLTEPLVVSSLSRAHPKNGKRVELSGAEPFNSIVRPLTKAATMFKAHWRSRARFPGKEIVARLVFPIAVVDAPLLAVRGRRGRSDITPIDWMRIFARHPASLEGTNRRGLGFDVVDLVAASYFDAFLEQHLMPFASEFALSLSRIQDCVLSGQAVLPGYNPGESLPWNWLDELRAL